MVWQVRDNYLILVERPTVKSGAVNARSTSPAWRGIFLPESTFSADSLTVSVQPLSAIACLDTCAHVQNPKHWQPYTIVWTHENIVHTRGNG